MRSRGEYCVTHQTEQKCRNLMSAIRTRYDACSRLPKTDPGCQSFKVSLCAAFPNFSPCLNGGAGFKVRIERKIRQTKFSLFSLSDDRLDLNIYLAYDER